MPSSPGSTFDVIAIGETMVGYVSRDDPRHVTTTVAGAESNLAVGVAQLGCRARWVSRLGADPLGDLVVDELTSRGVDVVADRDPQRPTGVLTRHVTGGRTVVQYYRSESAARELGPDILDGAGTAAWFHVTGITPALSPSAAALVEAVVDRSRGSGGRVSFDVNYRPRLWPDPRVAAERLLDLAQRADVVFIGDDEADALFGSTRAEAVAEMIVRRDDQELVFKRGAGPATVVTAHDVVTEPATAATVVDPTGAGDAFASGYLAGHVLGVTVANRLRLAHVMGARAVSVVDDMPRPLDPTELADLVRAGLVAGRTGENGQRR